VDYSSPSNSVSTICRRPDLALDVYCCRLRLLNKMKYQIERGDRKFREEQNKGRGLVMGFFSASKVGYGIIQCMTPTKRPHALGIGSCDLITQTWNYLQAIRILRHGNIRSHCTITVMDPCETLCPAQMSEVATCVIDSVAKDICAPAPE